MHDLIDHLRKMGEDRVIDIFKVKRTSPDLFDRVLRLFYVKRQPLSIKEICEDLDADYPVTHNIITKLVHIGMLSLDEGSKTGNQFTLSQEGIDFYLNYSTIELDNKIIDAISKKHSVTILKLLKNKEYSWTDLRKDMRVGESSMKSVIDDLSNLGLIDKAQGEYSLSEDGVSVLDALNSLSEIKFTPAFEVQIKMLAENLQIYKIIEEIEGVIKKKQVRQTDHYFTPNTSVKGKSYLRLRSEVPLYGFSLRTLPEHSLTWTSITDRRKHDNLWIISRQKEEIDVRYPAIIFYLDFLGARIHKKIVKKRAQMEIPDKQVTINIDEIEEPKKAGIFIEIKTSAWNDDEARNKIAVIQEIIKDIVMDNLTSIDQTYYELI